MGRNSVFRRQIQSKNKAQTLVVLPINHLKNIIKLMVDLPLL